MFDIDNFYIILTDTFWFDHWIKMFRSIFTYFNIVLKRLVEVSIGFLNIYMINCEQYINIILSNFDFEYGIGTCTYFLTDSYVLSLF